MLKTASPVLDAQFFNRPTLKVARDLPGKYLCRRINGKILSQPLVEVEVYDGFDDKASHAHRGLTPRNAVMFGPAGYWYVYLCYGMHWMLNIVTGPREYPAAILIRGAVDYSGPGRLTKALQINKTFNGKQVTRANGLWLEDRGVAVSAKEVMRLPRVGIGYAGPVWTKKLYRFVWNASA